MYTDILRLSLLSLIYNMNGYIYLLDMILVTDYKS